MKGSYWKILAFLFPVLAAVTVAAAWLTAPNAPATSPGVSSPQYNTQAAPSRPRFQ